MHVCVIFFFVHLYVLELYVIIIIIVYLLLFSLCIRIERIVSTVQYIMYECNKIILYDVTLYW